MDGLRELGFLTVFVYIVRGFDFACYGLMSFATRIFGGGEGIGLAATKCFRAIYVFYLFCAGTSVYIRLARRTIARITKYGRFAFLSYRQAIICSRLRESH